MRIEAEKSKLIRCLIIGALFVVSGFVSCTEIKYAIWGRTSEATILRTFKFTQYRGRPWPSVPKLGVEYEFREADGTVRKESVSRARDWPIPADKKITIDYLPGVWRASRLSGEWNYIAVTFFAISFGVLAFFVVRTWRAACK